VRFDGRMLFCCRETVPALREAGGGAIVNTSSVIALVAVTAHCLVVDGGFTAD